MVKNKKIKITKDNLPKKHLGKVAHIILGGMKNGKTQ